MSKNVVTIVTFAVLIALFAFAANDWKPPFAKEPAHGSDWCAPHQVEMSKCET